MKLQHFIFVLCFIALWNKTDAIRTMEPLGNIIIHAVYECPGADKPTGDDLKLKVDLIDINSKGDKGLNIIFENKIAFDNNNFNYIVEYNKFENGSWKNFYSLKGKPCRDFDRYIKAFWKKLTEAAVPKLHNPCPIPPGSYKLDKFHANAQDIGLKVLFHGQILGKVSFSDKNGNVVACIMVEGDSQASYKRQIS